MTTLDLASYIINKSIDLNKPVNWATLNRIMLLIDHELDYEYGIKLIPIKELDCFQNKETNEILDVYITSVKYEFSSHGASKLIVSRELKYYLDYDLLDKIDPILIKYLDMTPGTISDIVKEKVISKLK